MAPPIIELHHWFFRFNDEKVDKINKFGIMIEGYKAADESLSDMSNWRTTAIKKANGRLIETGSGSQYKLIGDIDVKQAKSLGHPDLMIEMFKKGFPANWESILREYYNKLVTSNPLNASNWFTHKVNMEKKRESIGANLNQQKRKSRMSIKPNGEPIAEESEENTKEIQIKTIKKEEKEEENVRRSPRIQKVSNSQTEFSVQSAAMATPNVSKMILSGANQMKTEADTTPRFVPNSEGRFPRGIIPDSTPTKRQGKKAVPQIEIPDISAKVTTPKMVRAPSESPRSAQRMPQDQNSIATRTRSASVTPIRLKEMAKTQMAEKKKKTPTKKETPAKKKEMQKTSNSNGKGTIPSTAERKSRVITKMQPKSQELVSIRSASVVEQPAEKEKEDLPSGDTAFKAPQIIRSRAANVLVANQKSATVLANWFIKFLPEMLNKSGSYPPFILVGVNVSSGVVNDANQSWHTTIITEVREGNTPEECSFFTVRGSEYKTSGKISIKDMVSQHQWFTKEFVTKFAFGFPCDWMPQLWAAFERFQENRKSNLSTSLNPINNEAIDMAADEFEVAKPPERIRSISVDNGGLNETITKSERIVRRPSEVAISMPLLNVERGGSQRVIAKKRTVNYSSSDSDDNQAVINTLKAIKYDKNRHEPRPKKIKLSDNWNYEAETLRRVQRKRLRLSKEIEELDRMTNELISSMQKKMAARQRVSFLDDEEIQTKKRFKAKPHGRYHQEISESSDEESTPSESDSESDENSSSSNSGDSDDWKSKRIKKTSRKVGRKVTKKSRKAPSNKARKAQILTDSEEEMIEEPKKVKRATWRQYDLEKLKRILSLQKVRNDDDWKQIADALGAEFTPEDCKSVAMKKFNWKQPVENTKEAKESIVITAKQGTQAYKIQSDEQCRKYMLGAGSQEGDFFRQQAPQEDEEDLIIDGELDESIMEVLKTPTLHGRQKKENKRAAGPCFPEDFKDEDTPRQSRKSHVLNEPDTAEREQHQRYLHHITNNRSHLNATRNNTTQNISMMDRSRAVENIGRNIDKITKNFKKQKKTDIDGFDEEEEYLM